MSWQAYVDDHLMCEIEGNYLSAAAIIGHDGSVWAQSSSFPQVCVDFTCFGVLNKLAITSPLFTTLVSDFTRKNRFKPEEIAAIMTDFAAPGSLAPTGLHFGGTKYMVIQGEPGAVIRGKKITQEHKKDIQIQRNFKTMPWIYAPGTDDYNIYESQNYGPGGVTVKMTSQALIIGIYDEPMTPGQCNMIVEKLGDYLIEQGL
ncbi:unnamed protein product [Camellia sinensis]